MCALGERLRVVVLTLGPLTACAGTRRLLVRRAPMSPARPAACLWVRWGRGVRLPRPTLPSPPPPPGCPPTPSAGRFRGVRRGRGRWRPLSVRTARPLRGPALAVPAPGRSPPLGLGGRAGRQQTHAPVHGRRCPRGRGTLPPAHPRRTCCWTAHGVGEAGCCGCPVAKGPARGATPGIPGRSQVEGGTALCCPVPPCLRPGLCPPPRTCWSSQESRGTARERRVPSPPAAAQGRPHPLAQRLRHAELFGMS